jgi:hypothetical protein
MSTQERPEPARGPNELRFQNNPSSSAKHSGERSSTDQAEHAGCQRRVGADRRDRSDGRSERHQRTPRRRRQPTPGRHGEIAVTIARCPPHHRVGGGEDQADHDQCHDRRGRPPAERPPRGTDDHGQAGDTQQSIAHALTCDQVRNSTSKAMATKTTVR